MPNVSPSEKAGPDHPSPLSTDQCFQDHYAKLKQIALRLNSGERSENAEPPAALVHEAYLRLCRRRKKWRSRSQFLATAAKATGWVLVEAARARDCQRRGEGAHAVVLHENLLVEQPRRIEELDVSPALAQLSRRDELKSTLVRMRLVDGLTIEESGQRLSISPATVSREWRGALSYLRKRMENRGPAPNTLLNF